MNGVKPYLMFAGNCREAIDFYRDCLGGEVLFTQTFGESPMSQPGMEDKIMHTTLKVGDSIIMASDGNDGEAADFGSGISMAMGVDDPAEADAMFQKMAEGGEIKMPIQETFWAIRFGMLKDKFGVNWMFNCEKPHGEQ